MAKQSGFDDAIHGIYGEHDAQDVDAAEGFQSLGPLPIACFIFGILSALTFLSWSLVLFPIIGLVLGGLALYKIINAPEIMTGTRFVIAGVVLSLTFWIVGYGWLIWAYYHQAPPGYEVVDWQNIVADAQTRALPPIIENLDGRRVFIHGWMYPSRHQTGLKRFTMCRTVGHCKFCEPITNPTDVIYVKCTRGMSVNFTTRRIGIGGVFKLNDGKGENTPHDTPYIIEADCFR